jgi:hypothetical protein
MISVIVLAISMPETRGHSLEAIQEGFKALVRRRAGWRVQTLFSGPRLIRPDLPNASSGEGVLSGSFRIELGSV